jgi:release factor glutamine methyltransferase
VLDVGVGCGAIALSLADEHPTARITGFDSSKDSLVVAQQNLRASGLDGRVRLIDHDLRGSFGVNRFDLVVSNPPYVDEDDVESLEPEVRDWEPREALVAPGATEAVARGAYEALRHGGWLVLEVADGKAGEISAKMDQLGYADITIDRDLAGRERIVSGRKG